MAVDHLEEGYEDGIVAANLGKLIDDDSFTDTLISRETVRKLRSKVSAQ